MTHAVGWLDFYRYWLLYYQGDVHVIFYNNLKEDRYNELSKAIKFLNIKANPFRLNCTVYYPKPAYFKRPDIPPPVDKHKLFRLAVPKANRAISMFEDFLKQRFGAKSKTYQRRNLKISVPELQ